MTSEQHTVDTDYGRLTPLEYLSLAGQERIHTETLRWLFSEDSPLEPSNRLAVLEHLAGPLLPGATISYASTEYKHLDLIVRLDGAGPPHDVVIENKLKSAEHSSQLARYDDYLAGRGDCTKLFLTLVAEGPTSSSSWRAVSYDKLEEAVRLARPVRKVEYVSDYKQMLGRLVGAVKRVTTSPDLYAGNGAVFGDPIDASLPADFAPFKNYVQKMRLRTILQKAWMRALGLKLVSSSEINFADWHVAETRGSALLHFSLRQVEDNGLTYDVGVQLQNQVFKVFCAPLPYRKGAAQRQHEVVEHRLLELRKRLGLDQQRLTSTHEFGFRSFSAGNLAPTGTLSIAMWSSAFQTVLERVAKGLPEL